MASPVMHSQEQERTGKYVRTFNPDTGETLYVNSPTWYKEDFLKTGTAATAATVMDFTGFSQVGTPGTIVLATSYTGGAISIPIASTSETETTGIGQADNLIYSLNKGLNFEAKFNFTAASMAASCIVTFGWATAHNATLTSISGYLFTQIGTAFALQTTSLAVGGSVVNNAALQTLVSATEYIIRMDCSNNAAPRLFVNGVAVTLPNAHDLSGNSAANAKVQPYIRIDKVTTQVAGVLQVDYVAFWQDR